MVLFTQHQVIHPAQERPREQENVRVFLPGRESKNVWDVLACAVNPVTAHTPCISFELAEKCAVHVAYN
jgi:hypothetical protein